MPMITISQKIYNAIHSVERMRTYSVVFPIESDSIPIWGNITGISLIMDKTVQLPPPINSLQTLVHYTLSPPPPPPHLERRW